VRQLTLNQQVDKLLNFDQIYPSRIMENRI